MGRPFDIQNIDGDLLSDDNPLPTVSIVDTPTTDAVIPPGQTESQAINGALKGPPAMLGVPDIVGTAISIVWSTEEDGTYFPLWWQGAEFSEIIDADNPSGPSLDPGAVHALRNMWFKLVSNATETGGATILVVHKVV